MTGVSFASAGSGYDPLTPKISVFSLIQFSSFVSSLLKVIQFMISLWMQSTLSLPEQLAYFREYKARLAQKIGKTRTDEIVSKALFVISAGTNDFVVNYITLPVRRRSYTISEFEMFILQNIHQFTQVWHQIVSIT